MILKARSAVTRSLTAGVLIAAATLGLAGCKHGGHSSSPGVNPPAVLPTAEPPRHAPLDPTLIVRNAPAELAA